MRKTRDLDGNDAGLRNPCSSFPQHVSVKTPAPQSFDRLPQCAGHKTKAGHDHHDSCGRPHQTGGHRKGVQANAQSSRCDSSDYCRTVSSSLSSNEDPHVGGKNGSKPDAEIVKFLLQKVTFVPEVGYKCSVCGRQNVDKRNLLDHVARKHSEKTLQCKVCNKKYAMNKHLQAHMEVHHCDDNQEGRPMKSKAGRIRHQAIHYKHRAMMATDVLPCVTDLDHDNEETIYREDLDGDIVSTLLEKVSVGPEGGYKCNVCGHWNAYKRNVLDHVARKHCEKTLHCKVCSKTFALSKHVQAHMEHHSKYDQNDSLRNYQKLLAGQSTFQAPLDNQQEVTETDQALSRPVADCLHEVDGDLADKDGASIDHQNGKPPEEVLKCRVCSRIFALTKHLQVHMESHSTSSEQLGMSRISKTLFEGQESLAVCEPTMSQEVDTPSSDNEDRYSGNQELADKEGGAYMDNRGDNPDEDIFKTLLQKVSFVQGAGYKCGVCGCQNVDKRNMLDHMARKHSEKVFQCKLCNKKYALWKHLQAHMGPNHGGTQQKDKSRKGEVDTGGQMLSQATSHSQTMVKETKEPRSMTDSGDGHDDYHDLSCTEIKVDVNRDSKVGSPDDDIVNTLLQKVKCVPGSGYTCSVCGHWNGSKRCLVDHVARKHGEKTFRCKFCSKKYALNRHLQAHMQLHRKKTQKARRKREQTLLSPPEQMHIQSLSKIVTQTANKEADEPSSMANSDNDGHSDPHNLEHNGAKGDVHMEGRKFHCDEEIVRVLLQNVKSVQGAGYTCHVCGHWSGYRRDMLDHVARKHGKKTLKCKLCRKTFALHKHLQIHMERHHSQDQQNDRQRNNKTPSSESVRSQTNIHDQTVANRDDEPFCASGQSEGGHPGSYVPTENKDGIYMDHRVDNPDEEIVEVLLQKVSLIPKAGYKCDVCDHRSVDKRNILDHVARKHSEKTLQCKLCSKKFALNKHLRAPPLADHVGENQRDYSCDLCGQAFRKLHQLRMPFNCTFRQSPL